MNKSFGFLIKNTVLASKARIFCIHTPIGMIKPAHTERVPWKNNEEKFISVTAPEGATLTSMIHRDSLKTMVCQCKGHGQATILHSNMLLWTSINLKSRTLCWIATAIVAWNFTHTHTHTFEVKATTVWRNLIVIADSKWFIQIQTPASISRWMRGRTRTATCSMKKTNTRSTPHGQKKTCELDRFQPCLDRFRHGFGTKKTVLITIGQS